MLETEDYRITLWRNTVQLFHSYKKANFVGPFKACGFRYIVERTLLDKNGEDKTPDITASSDSGWMVIDLTTSDNSKEPKLNAYMNIDPSYLSTYGLKTHNNEPSVLSGRLSFIDDGPYCQLTVKDKLVVIKSERIENETLRNTLLKSDGIDLTKLPEIPISLVPEMRGKEIRRGLIDIVMQIFEPGNSGKTPSDIVREGLDRLWDAVGHASRRSLIDRVTTEMDILIREYLSDYLVFKDGIYKATERFKPHHNTMAKISFKLAEWSGKEAPTTLEDFLNNN